MHHEGELLEFGNVCAFDESLAGIFVSTSLPLWNWVTGVRLYAFFSLLEVSLEYSPGPLLAPLDSFCLDHVDILPLFSLSEI